MHKSAMQMQHARDIQRNGSGSTGTSESKPHQCQQCLKSFSSNHQLVQHIRVHTGENVVNELWKNGGKILKIQEILYFWMG